MKSDLDNMTASPETEHAANHISGLTERRLATVNERSPRVVAKRQVAKRPLPRDLINQLTDAGSFLEVDRRVRHGIPAGEESRPGPNGDGIITGAGTVDTRPVCVFVQDFTVLGATTGETHGRKYAKIMELAHRLGCPVIGFNESDGARGQDGAVSLGHYESLGEHNAAASGVIPQIAVITGPYAGGAVYSPAAMDFTVMVDRTSGMLVNEQDIVRSVAGEQVTAAELDGTAQHAEVSGNVHYVAEDEADAVAWVRDLLSFLPSNSQEAPPVYPSTATVEVTRADQELNSIIPDSPNQSYDVRNVIYRITDDGRLLEVQQRFARNIVCGFARIDGHSVGIVANQPAHRAGTLDADAAEKGARFVRFCDAFNIPLLTLVDLPGSGQEASGIIRRGAKLIVAFAEATVPMVTIVLRKAHGGGYTVMASKHVGAEVNLAWPTAEIAVTGEQAPVGLWQQGELQAAPEAQPLTPYAAAKRGYIDAVIPASHTRVEVIKSLRMLRQRITRDGEQPRSVGPRTVNSGCG